MHADGTPRRRVGCVTVAAALSVAILVLTFTKEPVPDREVSIDTLRKHYGWQGAVLGLADAIERNFPQDFAGAELGTDERHSGFIGFRAGVPAGAEELLAWFRSDPRNGVVEIVTDLGFTAAELRSRTDAAYAAAAGLDVVGDAVARSDERTGVISLEVTRADGVTWSDDELREAVLAAVREGAPVAVVPWQEGARASADAQPVRVDVVAPGDLAPR